MRNKRVSNDGEHFIHVIVDWRELAMMRLHPLITFAGFMILIVMIGATAFADSENGNWRRGRIYYRLVCTSCHVEASGKPISPSEFTIAEWKAYLDQDLHHPFGTDVVVPSVRYYLSRRYRESVKKTNRAAEKFLELPEDVLFNDLRSFVIHGAKDSETPMRCK